MRPESTVQTFSLYLPADISRYGNFGFHPSILAPSLLRRRDFGTGERTRGRETGIQKLNGWNLASHSSLLKL
jgi:hypothetical protein